VKIRKRKKKRRKETRKSEGQRDKKGWGGKPFLVFSGADSAQGDLPPPAEKKGKSKRRKGGKSDFWGGPGHPIWGAESEGPTHNTH